MKKLISFVLAAVMLLCTLFGCAKTDTSDVVMRYGETVITESMYKYYVATHKALAMYEYSDVKDNPSFWTTKLPDGQTGEEKLRELIYGRIAQTLVAAEEFRKAGLSLTAEQEQSVDVYIEKMVNNYADGSRKTLNDELSKYGIGYGTLRDILLMEQKMEVYREYLYGENGVLAIDDAAREKYYTENFVRYKQIYINTTYVVKKDEDGFPVQDNSGNYVTRELTEEEKKEAELRVKAVREGLEAGADFDATFKTYSENKDYPRGYYFSPATFSKFDFPIVSKAISLKEGEWAYIEDMSELGAFFIMRFPLEEGGYKDSELAPFFEGYDEILRTELFDGKMEESFGDIEKNDAYIDSVSVQDSPINYNFY